MNDAQARFQAQWDRLVDHYQDPRVRPLPSDWDAFTETIHEASLADKGYVARIVEAVLALPVRPQDPRTLGTWMAFERCTFHGFAYLNGHRLPQHPPLGYRTWDQVPSPQWNQAANQWGQLWSPVLRERTAEVYARTFDADTDPRHEMYTTPLLACLRRLGDKRLRTVERQVPGCTPAHLRDWAGVVLDGLTGTVQDATMLTHLVPHLPADQWDRWQAQGDRARWGRQWGRASALTATWDHLAQIAARQRALTQRSALAGPSRRPRT